LNSLSKIGFYPKINSLTIAFGDFYVYSVIFVLLISEDFMRLYTIFLPLFFLFAGMTAGTFKEKEMNFTRVREAYANKGKIVDKTLAGHSISNDSLRIYLRAFKTEKIIELWAKNSSDTVFKLVKEFPICEMSGSVGPKRRSHDLQVPEGFYTITDLNPFSKYYLSIKVSYPNASDSIRGVRGHLGSNIFIHGSCMSSGCLAITNERIKELYVYCTEAYNSGQEVISLAIFPAKLNDASFAGLISRYSKDKDKISLWTDLKKSYDLFNQTGLQPVIRFLPDGSHDVN
jgi:murein L,D-transpeptidase YafK